MRSAADILTPGPVRLASVMGGLGTMVPRTGVPLHEARPTGAWPLVLGAGELPHCRRHRLSVGSHDGGRRNVTLGNLENVNKILFSTTAPLRRTHESPTIDTVTPPLRTSIPRTQTRWCRHITSGPSTGLGSPPMNKPRARRSQYPARCFGCRSPQLAAVASGKNCKLYRCLCW